MALTKFEILDKAVSAGGVNLAAAALGGNGAAAKAIREELILAGHIAKVGSKFSLTPEGKAARQQLAAEQKEQEAQQAVERLTTFVSLVQKKDRKKLTKPELASTGEAARNEAVKLGYVSATEEPAIFGFLPAGEAYLLSLRPISEQVADLQQSAHTLISGVKAAQQRLSAQLGQLGSGSGALLSVADAIQRDATAAGETFQKVVGELAGFGRLLEAAHQFRQATESRIVEAQRHLDTETARLGELKQELQKLTGGPQTELMANANRISARIEELERKLTAERERPVPVPPPVVPPVAVPPPIEQEIVAFVAEWTREKTVGPPFDAIMKHLRTRHRELAVGAFHDAIRRLLAADPPRIKVSVWSKTIHELPEPELALFVTHKVMYYAHPAH